MRKALAVGISALLLAWGAIYFFNQVTQMAPETGVEWTILYTVRKRLIVEIEFFWDHREALELLGLPDGADRG